MNTFLQRASLFGAVFAPGLLGAMQVPAALAGEGQAGHDTNKAEAESNHDH